MEKINDLLQKDMTRKEFLTTVGMGLATVFGLSAILRLLTGRGFEAQQSSYGYGSGPYGGRKDS